LVAFAAEERITPCPDCEGAGFVAGGVHWLPTIEGGERSEVCYHECRRCDGSGWIKAWYNGGLP
jgi:hypothetical protein